MLAVMCESIDRCLICDGVPGFDFPLAKKEVGEAGPDLKAAKDAHGPGGGGAVRRLSRGCSLQFVVSAR